MALPGNPPATTTPTAFKTWAQAVVDTLEDHDDTLEDFTAPVASAVAFTPAGTIAATDVQAAIVEVAAEAGSGGAIRVEDEGTSIVAAATGINFAGTGVTVTDAGSNEALVTISAGGGSSLVDFATVKRQTGTDITANNNSGTYAEVAAATNGPGTGGFDLTLSGVQTGDEVEYMPSFLLGNQGVDVMFDVVTRVSGANTNYISNGTSTVSAEGVRGWYSAGSSYRQVVGPFFYTLQSGDIASGSVTLRLMYRTSSATNRTLYTSTNGPLQLSARAWHL